MAAIADPAGAVLCVWEAGQRQGAQLVDENSAKGRCYFQVLTDCGLDHWGRYVDEYKRVDGAWRFARRVRLLAWTVLVMTVAQLAFIPIARYMYPLTLVTIVLAAWVCVRGWERVSPTSDSL